MLSVRRPSLLPRACRSIYCWAGCWACGGRLLLFLATFFRGALGSRTLLLGCLRGHDLGRGWLVVVLLLLRHLLLLEGALAL